jgi:hypothetical protein
MERSKNLDASSSPKESFGPSPTPIEKERCSITKPNVLFYQFYLQLNAEHGYDDDLLVLMLPNKLLAWPPSPRRGIEGEVFIFLSLANNLNHG